MMHSLHAQFSDVDDLLREAVHGRLRDHGSIVIQNSGRIGPLIELIAGAQQLPGEYNSISFAGTFASKVREAWATGKPFGGGFNDQAGAFPLPAENPVETRDYTWQKWQIPEANAAKNRDFHAGNVILLKE